MRLVIRYLLHPLILIAAWTTWVALDGSDVAPLVVIIGSITVLMIIESAWPAETAWRQTRGEKATLIVIYFLFAVLLGIVISVYEASLVPALAGLRETLGLNIWPDRWPLLAQVLLLYFASEFIYYWVHRGLHRSSLLWRFSGHGFHHSYHNLHSVNAGATHPLETLFLALPAAIIGGLFGAEGAVFSAAATLLAANATLAHANVDANTPVINWLFTAPAHHRRHHSSHFPTSNTNYSCNAILWDRLFGTYSEGPVAQTGIGPKEPTLWQKFLLPIREPDYADTVSHRVDED